MGQMPLVHLLMISCYYAAVGAVYADHLFPRIHFTPPCFLAPAPHDIAATHYHKPSKLWHVMAGCWSQGGWQHLVSSDMVRWNAVGRPRTFGGTGGIVTDDDGSIVAYAMSGGKLRFWTATSSNATAWVPSNTTVPSCCNDPVVWKAGGRWYAITAAHGSGGKNFGAETFFTSPFLQGNGANWTALPLFFQNKDSMVVPGYPQQREFVSPDYFDNIPGSRDGSSSVFMTSTYGALPQDHVAAAAAARRLTHDRSASEAAPGRSSGAFYNYAVMFVGGQPAGPGTPFVPNIHLTTAVDWSCFSPSNTTSGGLDLAKTDAPSQFGCCPKTGGEGNDARGRTRRVMFGWQQQGGSDGSAPGTNSSENTMTLPRDLSMSSVDGSIRQSFIPELQALRLNGAHWHAESLAFPDGGAAAGAVALPAPAKGLQLEIMATLTYPASGVGQFGFLVLAEETDGSEYTEVGFDVRKSQVYVDRRMSSGGEFDADVRAGPWPSGGVSGSVPGKVAGGGGSVSVHMYVDHSVVTLIAGNQTGISVWVHPLSVKSDAVKLFADGPGVTMVEGDIWQLRDAN